MAAAPHLLPPKQGGKVRLIVAEKPSVARDLARLLGIRDRIGIGYVGGDTWITWCIGHMAELAPPEHYRAEWRSWHLRSLPMLPKPFALSPASRNEMHWRALKPWLLHRRVSLLVNACDAGREGELIFRFVTELAGCRTPSKRLWLHALTDQALKRGLANMQPSAAFDPLADAARCRAEADWLVGLNATRALTLVSRKSVRDTPLCSVGRVQTPTLAMLVQREEAIEAFVQEAFFEVDAEVSPGAPPTETSTSAKRVAAVAGPADAAPGRTTNTVDTEAPAWRTRAVAAEAQRFTPQGTKTTGEPRTAASGRGGQPPVFLSVHRFAKQAAAQAVAKELLATPGRVHRHEERQEQQLPPLLYDLTSLQREANVRFGLRATATLAAAQALYEQDKALTYPRTDSNYLPTDLQPSLQPLLARLVRGPWQRLVQPVLNPPWAAHTLKRIINDAEVSDHHAIIPTGKAPALVPGSDKARVYELVLRRFLAAFYPPATLSQTTLTVQVGPHTLIGRGRVCLQPGWQAVEPPLRPVGAPAEVPNLRTGDACYVRHARVRDSRTQPPPRLSEATLLQAMERAGEAQRDAPDATTLGLNLKQAGLGTPATRAAVIETLKKRAYISEDGRQLRPTAAGRALLAALPSAALKSAKMTSMWERKLSLIAQKKMTRAAFMAEIQTEVQQLLQSIVQGQARPSVAPRAARPSRAT